jgi:hypothetical protein
VPIAFGFGKKEDPWWDVVRTIWKKNDEGKQEKEVSEVMQHESSDFDI